MTSITQAPQDSIVHDGYRFISTAHLEATLKWRELYEQEVARETLDISRRIANVSDTGKRMRIIDDAQRAFQPIRRFYERELAAMMILATPVTYWTGDITP